MFDWIEKIRSAPPSKRRFVAFAAALLVTGCVFVLWLAVWLPADKEKQNEVQKNSAYETPAQNFWGNFQTAWSGLSTQFGELKSSVQNIDWSSAEQYKATSTATTTGNQ